MVTGHVLACQCLAAPDLTLATASTACTSARVTCAEPLVNRMARHAPDRTGVVLSARQSVADLPRKGAGYPLIFRELASQGREMVVDITRREQGGLSPVSRDARNIGRTV